MRRKDAGLPEFATDSEVFEAFYRRHLETITRFVARRTDDPHVVADLVADVFFAVLDSAHTYRSDRGSETGWLYGVARNVLSAESRRVAKEYRLAQRIAGQRLLDADDVARLEDRIDAEKPARLAINAMARLPKSERVVLELVAIDQLSLTEAAAALGIRQGAARTRLHRARRSLSQKSGINIPDVVEGPQ